MAIVILGAALAGILVRPWNIHESADRRLARPPHATAITSALATSVALAAVLSNAVNNLRQP